MRAFVKTRVVADSNKMATRLAWTIGLLAFALRFFAITQPFIDSWSWRESDVAAIARNFFENGFRFAYPQIDWAGDAAGYVGTEFPLLPFASRFSTNLPGSMNGSDAWKQFCFLRLRCRFSICWCGASSMKRRRMGARFLQLCSALYRRESRFHAGFPVALLYRLQDFIFFCAGVTRTRRERTVSHPSRLASPFSIKGTSAIVGLPLLYLGWQRFGLTR